MPHQQLVLSAVHLLLATPVLLLGLLALPSLVRRPWAESSVANLTRFAMLVAFVAAATAVSLYYWARLGPLTLSYGSWFSSGESEFSFTVLVDGLSLAFATLCTGVCGVVAAFSCRYLHRERGFNRYFIQFALFVAGLVLVSLAASAELLFAGWEFIGLSSALLVGFFHERRGPVDNALRVFAVYRVSDAAMLTAVVLLHHWAGSSSLVQLFSGEAASTVLSAEQRFVVALLLLVAVAGKSALLPFSGWLPRAMEGPTPSSAVYYGSLSVHAGCFLLLRAQPLIAESLTMSLIVGLVGGLSAIYATLIARVQSDVKSALAYAALTQVGIIVLEVALGLHRIAFVHMVGHACFRLLQFLSAPNVLHDLHELENRLGGHLWHDDRCAPPPAPASRLRRALYLFALERGFLDRQIDRLVVVPLSALAALLDRFDRSLCGGTRADQTPQQEGKDEC